MTTLNRIKQYLDYKGISNQKFEKIIGFSNGAFGSQLKNNRTIGVDKLENILISFQELNPTWLLTGEGSMLKSTLSSQSINGDYSGNNVNGKVEINNGNLTAKGQEYKQETEILKKEIEFLKKEIQSKEDLIKTKDQLIELLRSVK